MTGRPRRGAGCLWTLLALVVLGGAFALLVGLDPGTRRALGVRPFVRLEWSLDWAEGREGELSAALRRIPHERHGLVTTWARLDDRLWVSVQLPGEIDEADDLRARVEPHLPPAWGATFEGATPAERQPLWVSRVARRVQRIGSHVERWLGLDGR